MGEAYQGTYCTGARRGAQFVAMIETCCYCMIEENSAMHLARVFRKYIIVLYSIVSFAKELLDSSHFQKVTLATNLLEPIQLSISQSGDVYFAERHGTVKWWKNDTGE